MSEDPRCLPRPGVLAGARAVNGSMSGCTSISAKPGDNRIRRTILVPLGLLALATTSVCQGQIRDVVVTSGATFEPGLPPKGSIGTLFCRGLTGIDGVVSA